MGAALVLRGQLWSCGVSEVSSGAVVVRSDSGSWISSGVACVCWVVVVVVVAGLVDAPLIRMPLCWFLS